MPDTDRTRAELESLLADNATQAISPQDLRDLLASLSIQLRGSGPPTVTPEQVGDRYWDEANLIEYTAINAGQSPSDDNWRMTFPRHKPIYGRVDLTSSETITTNSWTTINWDRQEVDDYGWWASGNPSRLTVPSGYGITRVVCRANVELSTGSAGAYYILKFLKNGAELDDRNWNLVLSNNAYRNNLISNVVTATSGDYFELQVYTNASAPNASAVDQTWFEVEAVDYA